MEIETIETIGVIAQVVIAFFNLILLIIISLDALSRWWGVRNIRGQLLFQRGNNPVIKEPGFMLLIQNKSRVKQIIMAVHSDKTPLIKKLFFWRKKEPDMIKMFHSKEKKTNQPFFGREMGPGVGIAEFLNIAQRNLDMLERSKGIYVSDLFDKRSIIISKKDIQKALKDFNRYKINS